MWPRAKSPKTSKSFDYYQQKLELIRQFEVVAEEAGVLEKINQIGRSFDNVWLHCDSGIPFGSQAWIDESKTLDVEATQYEKKRIRKIIFSVKDHDLRMQLIDLERKLHAIELKNLQYLFWDAEKSAMKVAKPKLFTGFMAGFLAFIIVVFAWASFGEEGGVPAAVFSLIVALFALYVSEDERKYDYENKKEKLADLETTIKETINEETFTSGEALRGEPDEPE